MPMQLITVRDRIKAVAGEWRRQYYNPVNTSWLTIFNEDAKERYTQLCGLDTNTCTKEEVDAIIGNSSWTRLVCDNCGKEVEAIVQIGQELDYESSTANVCGECLGRALAMLVN